MGYVQAFAHCIICRRLFAFNPMRVPSVVVRGQREPLCQDCVERANPLRRERGLPEIAILPGAYEACEESELE